MVNSKMVLSSPARIIGLARVSKVLTWEDHGLAGRFSSRRLQSLIQEAFTERSAGVMTSFHPIVNLTRIFSLIRPLFPLRLHGAAVHVHVLAQAPCLGGIPSWLVLRFRSFRISLVTGTCARSMHAAAVRRWLLRGAALIV